jgi:LPS-assembly protein
MPGPRGAGAAALLLLSAAFGWNLSAAERDALDSAVESTPESPGSVRLRLQRSLLPPQAPGRDVELPVFLEADRVQGTIDKSIEAAGNVVVRRRGQVLYSDLLEYSVPENAVTISGNVRLDRLGDIVTGDQAFYDLDTESGYISNPTYRLRQLGARGQANRLLILDRNNYRAERATYTSCAVGDDDWYLRVNRLDLDRIQDVGVARNATVRFKGAPILYTPWMDFPLSNRRKTGFLPPTIGSSSTSGFEFALPFYWNIAPNRDFTFTPRLLSRRGILLNNEFRYLEPKFAGQARVEYIPYDREFGADRYAYAFAHDQRFSRRLSGRLRLEGVSDDTYFVDLSDKIAVTSQTVLPREAVLNYNGDWWELTGRFLKFQTLQDPLVASDPSLFVDPPYGRVPQVLLRAARQNVLGFDLDFFGEFDAFQHPNRIEARRQFYYPSVSLPLRHSLFYVTPKVGYTYTLYNYTNTDRESDVRSLPTASVDSGMTFERDTTVFGRAFSQTLEPRLYYVYIPFRDQDDLPLFDTFVRDFNLSELFSENRFSGPDRINDANQITLAATTRLLEPKTGTEWIRATLGQRYYFEEQRVTLPPPDDQSVSGGRSDLLALVSGNVARGWAVDWGLQYDVEQSHARKFDLGVRYQPQLGKVLNFGYRYTRDTLEQVDFSTQWPLARRWVALARVNYSIQDNSLLEGLLGLEYNAGCWTARVVAHRFVTTTEEYSSSIFFQLELHGLSRLGTNPLELLRSNIVGYSRTSPRSGVTVPYYPGMAP